MTRRFVRPIAAVLLLSLLALCAYEGLALWRAHQRTPEVLHRAAQGELALADLSPQRRATLLKVEDPGFYRHNGFDGSTPGQGRTNLTQSLVKVFYFDHFQPGFAKLEQSLIARFIFNPALSKDGQLRAFLNHAYFGDLQGRPVIGFADAARTYYGRELGELGDRQFLSLVAMLMAPNRLDPGRHPKENAERVRRIEALLTGRCAPEGVADVNYDAC